MSELDDGSVIELWTEIKRLRERAETAERERDLALIEAGRQWRPGEWHTDAEWLAIGRTATGLNYDTLEVS